MIEKISMKAEGHYQSCSLVLGNEFHMKDIFEIDYIMTWILFFRKGAKMFYG